MNTDQITKPAPKDWKKILVSEFLEYLFNFAFLSFFLLSFVWYRRLILAEYHIQFLGYWMPLVEAAVLAKIVMVGDALSLGRGFSDRPLAVPVIYRTVVFSFLVVLFSVLEHVIGAWIRGKKASDGIAEITNKGWYELFAWGVLMIAAFMPFFTMKEVERAFGRKKVRRMFFGGHREEPQALVETKSDTAGKQSS
jgi:hypothetical protein